MTLVLWLGVNNANQELNEYADMLSSMLNNMEDELRLTRIRLS